MGPLLRATLQALTICAISNVIGQYLNCYIKSESFVFSIPDLIRFLALHLVTAPLNYKWQELLESTFPAYESSSENVRHLADRDVEKHSRFDSDPDKRERDQQVESPRLNWKHTLTKWFIDAITLGTIMNTSAFFVIYGILKGQSTSKIMHNLRTKMLTVIVNGWRVWPIASIISFSLIPVKNRIQFFSCVGLGWNIYSTVIAQNL